MVDVPVRAFATDGLALIDRPGVATLTPVNGLARFVLRCRPATEGAACEAFGLTLPAPINTATTKGERGAPGARAALRLGPDEFLLIAPEAEAAEIEGAFAARLAGQPHSLVAVSNRNQGLMLAGPQAAALLNAGCPLDLDLRAFPVGFATRTLFHKAEIVLWRIAEEAFRIEVWRSFAPYCAAMIAEAAKDHA